MLTGSSIYAGSPGPHLLQAVTLNRYSFASITSVTVCSRSRTPEATCEKSHHTFFPPNVSQSLFGFIHMICIFAVFACMCMCVYVCMVGWSVRQKLEMAGDLMDQWTDLHMYLHPGLAWHFSLLNLVVGDWTSSIMFWSLPHQVYMVPGHLSHLEVLWSTWAC